MTMLEMFSNETEYGKLYINYPMVESICYTKELPDKDYANYTVSREENAGTSKASLMDSLLIKVWITLYSKMVRFPLRKNISK